MEEIIFLFLFFCNFNLNPVLLLHQVQYLVLGIAPDFNSLKHGVS